MARRRRTAPESFPLPGRLVLHDEVVAALRRALLSGEWVLVDGPLESLTRFEEIVYPPGPENAGYAVILMVGNGRVGHLSLARKTTKLREFLNRGDDGLTEEEFRRLVHIEFGPAVEGQVVAVPTWLHRMGRAEFVDRFVRGLSAWVGVMGGTS